MVFVGFALKNRTSQSFFITHNLALLLTLKLVNVFQSNATFLLNHKHIWKRFFYSCEMQINRLAHIRKLFFHVGKKLNCKTFLSLSNACHKLNAIRLSYVHDKLISIQILYCIWHACKNNIKDMVRKPRDTTCAFSRKQEKLYLFVQRLKSKLYG